MSLSPSTEHEKNNVSDRFTIETDFVSSVDVVVCDVFIIPARAISSAVRPRVRFVGSEVVLSAPLLLLGISLSFAFSRLI